MITFSKLWTTIGFLITAIFELSSQKPNCKPEGIASPINLKFPMSYVPFNIKFDFKTLNAAELIKLAPNHLKILGEFGGIFYQNIEYRIYDVHFKYPSEHRINGLRYALEMQISTVSLDGAQFVIDVLFERNDYMSLMSLSNYGFDNEFVKKLPTFDKDEDKCRFDLKGALSMDDFLKGQTNFYLYEGSNINGDCKTALHLVLAEPLWVSEDQLSIFKEKQEPEYKTKRFSNAVIYQNFVKKEDYNLHNVTMTRRSLPNGPVPGPYSHLPYLYHPLEGKPVGFLSKEFLPIWKGIPGGIHIIEPEYPPKRNGHVKFIKLGYRPFKMPGIKRKYYIAQYLLVSKHYMLPSRGTPTSIPVYLRANFLTQGKFRPIIKMRLPLIMEGKGLNAGADSNKTAPSVACRKWWLHVTLNRNFQHELMYKNVSDSIQKMASVRKCADYFLLPSQKKMVKDIRSKDFGTNNVTINNTGSGGGGICKTHLHVLLNRDSDANLGDYVYQGCYQRKAKGFIFGKQFSMGKLSGFAQAKSTKGVSVSQMHKTRDEHVQEFLLQKSEAFLIENRALRDLEGQMPLEPH